jgi:hypothetical protein
MPYDHLEHRHRFAVWAAARAAQRGFTTVVNLKDALEQCGILDFLRDSNSLRTNQDEFEEWHREWCSNVVKFLSGRKVKGTSYGRAAKLIAVYLKTMVVIGPGWKSNLARVAHPPIDSVFLKNISKCVEVKSDHKKEWAGIRWTKLDKRGYYRLMSQLRDAIPNERSLWKLEKYWTVISD